MKIEKEISFWARALYLAAEENPGKAQEIFANLEGALGKKKVFLPAILKKFEGIYLKERTAGLTLAREVDAKTKEDIKEKIKGIIKGVEKIDDSVDEDLLAGFRLQTKDILVKASLKDVLQKVKNKTYGYN
jgi:F0F1-type ATP synthase delta subunit